MSFHVAEVVGLAGHVLQGRVVAIQRQPGGFGAGLVVVPTQAPAVVLGYGFAGAHQHLVAQHGQPAEGGFFVVADAVQLETITVEKLPAAGALPVVNTGSPLLAHLPVGFEPVAAGGATHAQHVARRHSYRALPAAIGGGFAGGHLVTEPVHQAQNHGPVFVEFDVGQDGLGMHGPPGGVG